MADRPYMRPSKVVSAPPATAPPHGLIVSVRDPGDSDEKDWQGGFGFLPEGCLEVFAWSPACAASGGLPGQADKAAPSGYPDAEYVLPFTLLSRIECTTAGAPSRDDVGRARRTLEAGTTKGLEEEFWSDTLGLGNFSLTKSTPNVASTDGSAGILNPGGTNPDPVSPEVALALLEQALADCTVGSRGVIHAPVFVASLWALRNYLGTEGPRLVTKVRNDIVVAGSGYPGTGPTGEPDEGGDYPDAQDTPEGTAWVFATAMVDVRIGPIEQIAMDGFSGVYDWQHNKVETLLERTVAADTDPCCTFAVLVDLP